MKVVNIMFFLYNYACRYNEFNLAISKIVLHVNFERRYHPESCTAENAMWKCHLYVYLICCLYCYKKHVFMKSDGICNSFINPTPYLEMGYFPLYTENGACIYSLYGLIFSLPTGISFIFVVYS